MGKQSGGTNTSGKRLGGAPLPMTSEDARVEAWDQWAEQSYGRVVFYLEKARRCYFDSKLAEFGISSAHMLVLTYLWEGHDGDTQSVIADILGVDPATITRVSQKLEEIGYIKRVTSTRDSRALALSLTEAGWEIAEPIQAISRSWTDDVTAEMSDRRRAEVLRALQKLTVRAQVLCGCERDPECGTD